jgi:hopanoid-associated phosphorylase
MSAQVALLRLAPQEVDSGGNRGQPGLGIICGLQREIACLGRPLPRHVKAFAAGGNAQRACEAATRWIETGAAGALMSFGMAGGLDPALRPGELVLSVRVHASGQRVFEGDAPWLERLRSRLPQAHIGAIESSGVPIRDPGTKRALAARNGALAVDMESEGVASAAARFAVPFVALRVVADPADCRVPAAALAGLSPRGGVRPLAVLARLLARPNEFLELLTIARHSGKALAQLRHAAGCGITDA